MAFAWLEEGTFGEKSIGLYKTFSLKFMLRLFKKKLGSLFKHSLWDEFFEMLQQGLSCEEEYLCKTLCMGKMKAMGGQEIKVTGGVWDPKIQVPLSS